MLAQIRRFLLAGPCSTTANHTAIVFFIAHTQEEAGARQGIRPLRVHRRVRHDLGERGQVK